MGKDFEIELNIKDNCISCKGSDGRNTAVLDGQTFTITHLIKNLLPPKTYVVIKDPNDVKIDVNASLEDIPTAVIRLSGPVTPDEEVVMSGEKSGIIFHPSQIIRIKYTGKEKLKLEFVFPETEYKDHDFCVDKIHVNKGNVEKLKTD